MLREYKRQAEIPFPRAEEHWGPRASAAHWRADEAAAETFDPI